VVASDRPCDPSDKGFVGEAPVTEVSDELSRRGALKRLGIGAAAVWAAPAVISIGPSVAAGSPAPTCSDPEPMTFLAYSSGQWDYRQEAQDSTNEDGIANGNLAGYSSGSAPFGNNAGCALTAVTNWSANSDLLARHLVDLPPCVTSALVAVAVDNNVVSVYWDGVNIGGPNNHEGCATPDSFIYPVPAVLATPGAHVVGVHAQDHGGVTYLDVEVRGLAGVLS
jgi:hypothetical protein